MSGTVGTATPIQNPLAVPVQALPFDQVLEAIRRSQQGQLEYRHAVENFFSPNRNFDLQLGEGRRQYDTTRTDKQALLNALGFGAGGGGIFASLMGNASGDAASDALLAGQRADRARLVGDVANYGLGERNRINTEFQNAENSALGNLESRGLGASNLQTATRSGFTADRNQSMLDLNDQLLGKRLDLETGMLGNEYATQTGQLDRANQRQLEGIGLLGSIAKTYS